MSRPRSMRPVRRRSEAGFTLLEVVVAMGILAVVLGALLQTQVDSMAAAGRSRQLTIATLLARSKMVDIEQKLFDEGFTLGDIDEEGDFTEEGHPDFKWKYKVFEVELDMSMLDSFMGGGDDEGSSKDAATAGLGAGGVMGGLGGSFDGFVQELGKSLRGIELTVSWNEGKYADSMSVHALVTKEDLTLAPTDAAGAAAAAAGAAQGGAGGQITPPGKGTTAGGSIFDQLRGGAGGATGTGAGSRAK